MIPDFEYKAQEPLDETQFREERCYQYGSSNLSYKQTTIGSIRCISPMKLSMAVCCRDPSTIICHRYSIWLQVGRKHRGNKVTNNGLQRNSEHRDLR